MTPSARPTGRRAGAVRVELYATARAAVGAREIDIPVPTAGVSVRGFVAALARDQPALGPILRHSRLVRGDDVLTGTRDRVRPGDRVSVHPPYGGG